MKSDGLLIVICGPSGAGKGTIYNEILKRIPSVKKSISVTTRAPRGEEKDGEDYYFRTIEQYQQMIAAGEFLETASVFSNYYGTPKAAVMKLLKGGNDVMFEIDVEGAKQIKAKYPAAILIFIMTKSFKVLEERLRGRATDREESIKTRLNAARGELSQYQIFDYIVFNDKIEDAVDEVEGVIRAEKARIFRNKDIIENILKA